MGASRHGATEHERSVLSSTIATENNGNRAHTCWRGALAPVYHMLLPGEVAGWVLSLAVVARTLPHRSAI